MNNKYIYIYIYTYTHLCTYTYYSHYPRRPDVLGGLGWLTGQLNVREVH